MQSEEASDVDVRRRRVFPGGSETVSRRDANPRREANRKGLRGTWVEMVLEFIILPSRLVVSPF